MFYWFHKTLPVNTFYVLVNEKFASSKKHVISTSVYLSLKGSKTETNFPKI